MDLHAKMIYLCVLDNEGKILLHRNISTQQKRFLKLIRSCREGIVVGVETIFSWYWLADLCQVEGIPFMVGHVLYMKAIHIDKTKNDELDAKKIIKLIHGGDRSAVPVCD